MKQNKQYGFTRANQDWIRLMIFNNFANQDLIGFNFCGSGLVSDWKISQSAHFWWTGSRFCCPIRPGISIYQNLVGLDIVSLSTETGLSRWNKMWQCKNLDME